MTTRPEQWEKIKEIVADALELPVGERKSFIEDACRGDQTALDEVRSLVSFDLPDASPDGNLSSLAPGAVLNGRYRIDRALARGGFATAWLALDQQLLNRRVVVKLLLSDGVDPYIRDKFSDELRALSALEHPNVIAPLDSGITAAKTPFLVMQYAEGQTLARLLSEGTMPLPRSARILAQIGHALSFIHAAGIIHRDLKPENVIVQTFDDGTDHIRLIDFGIASIGSTGGPHTTRIVGSLGYMAPEQLLGKVEPATDIYALGVVAYEMVTGVLPFPAETPAELARLLSKGRCTPPGRLRQALSPSAETLILQALHQDPTRRPIDAGSFADSLAESLETTEPPARKFTSTVLFAAATVVIALAVGIVLSLYPRSSAPQPAASPAQSNAASIASPALTLEVHRRIPPGAMLPETSGRLMLRSGDEFRIVLHNSLPGHLYIFSKDSSRDGLHILFPSPTSNGSSSFLSSAQVINIPGQSWFRLDDSGSSDHPGRTVTDTIDFVWSPVTLPQFESALRFANARDRGKLPESTESAEIRATFERSSRPLQLENSTWQLFLSDSMPFAAGYFQIDH